MDTLLGFMSFTKGIEYLIAIGFLLGFVAFWQWVYGKGRWRMVTIATMVYFLLAIGILVGSCLGAAPQ